MDELETIVRQVLEEQSKLAGKRQESDLQSKLQEERSRREALERRLEELKQESRLNRQKMEQGERQARVLETLQRLGVRKADLAYRLVKDEIFRGEDGDLYATVEGTRVSYEDYLSQFVEENPEFLPPRITGGSGVTGGDGRTLGPGGLSLENIRPGMSREEMEQAWKEVSRLAGLG